MGTIFIVPIEVIAFLLLAAVICNVLIIRHLRAYF